MVNRWQMAAAACALMATTPFAHADARGSLYPLTEGRARSSELGEALGAAGYVLEGSIEDEAFRRSVAQAVLRHPTYGGAAARVNESEEFLKAARAALYPSISTGVNADYSLTREFDAATQNITQAQRPSGQTNASLSVRQLLYDGGASYARIKSAKAQNAERRMSQWERTNELTIAALTAYHDLLAYQAIGRLGDEFIARHEKLLRQVSERERRGTGVKADVMRAAARLGTARARVVQIRESQRLAEIRYKEFFGAPSEDLAWPTLGVLAVSSQEEAIKAARARHPSLGAAQARLDEQRANVRAAKGARLPTLDASLEATKFDIGDGDDYDLRAGVNLRYDLFAGGLRRSAIGQARAAAKQSEYEAAQTELAIVRDAAIAFERQKANDERVKALETALISHHAARDLVAARFRASRGDLLDILQAENEWFEAGVAYLIGAATRDVAVYDLMTFTGDLSRLFTGGDGGSVWDEIGGGVDG